MFRKLPPTPSPALPENFSLLEVFTPVIVLLPGPCVESCSDSEVDVGRYHEPKTVAHGLEAERLSVVDVLQ